MTTDDRLLAQDDIDALLGEAGVEGNYDAINDDASKRKLKIHEEKSIIRFTRISDDEVLETMSILQSKAFLARDDDVKVIWNANGTIPMASGFSMNIQEIEYVSLGVLRENHLVVKQNIQE